MSAQRARSFEKLAENGVFDAVVIGGGHDEEASRGVARDLPVRTEVPQSVGILVPPDLGIAPEDHVEIAVAIEIAGR